MLIVVSVTRERGLTDDFILVVQDDNGKYTASVLIELCIPICRKFVRMAHKAIEDLAVFVVHQVPIIILHGLFP